jgi:predicted RNA binding protein YcfA (HicA-like mRNA interferase family)
MTYAELVRRLRPLGVEFVRQAGGSHELWWHPESRRTTIIPRHAGRDIRRGTLAKILKDLGLDMQDLERQS